MKPQEQSLLLRLLLFSEECSEAAQAADKLMRIRMGDATPVTEDEAVRHLLEEMADVYVTALALEPDRMTIEAIARQKGRRWEERLSNMEAADAFFTRKKREAIRKTMEEGYADEGE